VSYILVIHFSLLELKLAAASASVVTDMPIASIISD